MIACVRGTTRFTRFPGGFSRSFPGGSGSNRTPPDSPQKKSRSFGKKSRSFPKKSRSFLKKSRSFFRKSQINSAASASKGHSSRKTGEHRCFSASGHPICRGRRCLRTPIYRGMDSRNGIFPLVGNPGRTGCRPGAHNLPGRFPLGGWWPACCRKPVKTGRLALPDVPTALFRLI